MKHTHGDGIKICTLCNNPVDVEESRKHHMHYGMMCTKHWNACDAKYEEMARNNFGAVELLRIIGERASK
jgi:hypothetical protein